MKRTRVRDVERNWRPLALSWLLMGAELPLLSAFVARLPEGEIHLAAYGGVVFPVALVIESPVIMLLVASTALSVDQVSYRALRRFMMWLGGMLTLLHMAVAFTPLYYIVARDWIGAPEEILQPARLGLMLMTPWTWAIAYRRFNQGLLIRSGKSDAVGWGTLVRLIADSTVLVGGYLIGSVPGIAVATLAVSSGVIAEAWYVRRRVAPVRQSELMERDSRSPALTALSFWKFYTPLALTPFFTLLVQPLVTAAMSRMPSPIESLAVWPAVNGIVFMLRAVGIGFNEVVVSMVGRPGGFEALRRFTWLLGLGVTLLLVLIAATPIGGFWFEDVTGLRPELAQLAGMALWPALLLPALSAVGSWYQGLLVHGRKTAAITESVVLYLIACAVGLWIGAWKGSMAGIHVSLLALTVANFIQVVWNWYRSRTISGRMILKAE